MSADRALDLVNTLLDVLEEADRRQGQTSQTQQTEKTTEPTTTIPVSTASYFKSYEDLQEGQLIQVTEDVQLLQKEWDSAEMGNIETLAPYVSNIGKVVDIEDDDTVQVEWGNYDSFWLPVLACRAAPQNAKRTIPGSDNSWLLDKPSVEETKEEKVDYWTSIEDDGVKTGTSAKVTTNKDWLTQCWNESELGPTDGIESFLGCIGIIQDIEEDDDTIKLRWENFDEIWLPVKACSNANGAKATLPGSTVSWLS